MGYNTKSGRKGRTPKLPGNPEMPQRAQLEKIQLYLKQDPDIVNALMTAIEVNGLKTAPEAVRHLLYVGISATPTDGEFRAAMNSVKTQMTQYFTIRLWSLLSELRETFEKDWRAMHSDEFVNREIARVRGEIPPRCVACGHDGGSP